MEFNFYQYERTPLKTEPAPLEMQRRLIRLCVSLRSGTKLMIVRSVSAAFFLFDKRLNAFDHKEDCRMTSNAPNTSCSQTAMSAPPAAIAFNFAIPS
jgi:hypothetical protein